MSWYYHQMCYIYMYERKIYIRNAGNNLIPEITHGNIQQRKHHSELAWNAMRVARTHAPPIGNVHFYINKTCASKFDLEIIDWDVLILSDIMNSILRGMFLNRYWFQTQVEPMNWQSDLALCKNHLAKWICSPHGASYVFEEYHSNGKRAVLQTCETEFSNTGS